MIESSIVAAIALLVLGIPFVGALTLMEFVSNHFYRKTLKPSFENRTELPALEPSFQDRLRRALADARLDDSTSPNSTSTIEEDGTNR